MRTTKIAVVGATGLVGRTMIKVLQERNIHADFFLFAGQRSAGEKIEIFGSEYVTEVLSRERIKGIRPDFALFAAGGAVSAEWVPIFVRAGTRVIDNSSHFRMDKDVPLIVPEVNAEVLQADRHKIIANPNCSTIGAVVVLAPLDKVYKIKRVVYSTYQAVSGAGSDPEFAYPIEKNVLPQIDIFLPNGNTKEEEKMVGETKKILGRGVAVSATCVRVPVPNVHCVSLNIEFEKKPDIEEVKKILANSKGIILYDDPSRMKYPIPTLADGRDEVFVGRIRLDNDRKNTINMWTACDNIRKGAATNAVQILELLRRC
jgi:aspartate-semialdehyde dehydrogenase